MCVRACVRAIESACVTVSECNLLLHVCSLFVIRAKDGWYVVIPTLGNGGRL